MQKKQCHTSNNGTSSNKLEQTRTDITGKVFIFNIVPFVLSVLCLTSCWLCKRSAQKKSAKNADFGAKSHCKLVRTIWNNFVQSPKPGHLFEFVRGFCSPYQLGEQKSSLSAAVVNNVDGDQPPNKPGYPFRQPAKIRYSGVVAHSR